MGYEYREPRVYAMKKHHPGGSSYGYYWEDEDTVVLVAEEHVDALEASSHGDIYQVEVDHSEKFSEVAEPEEDDDEPDPHPILEPSAVSDLAEAHDAASVTKQAQKRPAKKAVAKKAAAPAKAASTEE